MHDAPPTAPLMPLTPLSRMLTVCAIEGKQAAVQLTASLTSPQRRTLHQEAAAAGFESLVTSILEEPDVLAEARGRIERFRFSQHLNAVWTMAGLLAAQGIRVLILKGTALALRRYAVPPVFQPWMRPAGDIDLFVEPSSMERNVRPRAFRSSAKAAIQMSLSMEAYSRHLCLRFLPSLPEQ